MKQSITIILLVFFCSSLFGQPIISGDYDIGLKISYDSTSKKITGFYENSTGWDEKTNSPKFICAYYFEGIVTGKKIDINSYNPKYKKDDQIPGTIEIVTNSTVQIKLTDDHGGCWNVEHFTNRPVGFTLEKSQPWRQIRYVNAAKANFYSDKYDDKQMKAYLIMGDIVCIEKIDKEWAYCSYFGKKTIKGWLKLAELNNL